MIFDDFFSDPAGVRADIDAADMADIKYQHDGVVYPNIVLLPASVREEVVRGLERVFGPIAVELAFARYSFKDTKPPHWAHSDREIADFLALIYLSQGDEAAGTACVRHKIHKIETHPTSEFHKRVLIDHANKRDQWDVTFNCPEKFNRLLILNTELVHAAMGEYGAGREDGRLVISVFFNAGFQ